MKRKMILWGIAGFVTVSLLGVLLHFLYDWTGSPFAALFSGVNESTWEHMKLLFFPMFFFAIVQSFFLAEEHENFWCVKLLGTLFGLALIPVLFYTLRGIFGTTPDWINITIFFVSAAVAFIYETLQFQKGSAPCRVSDLAFAVLCMIAIAFWMFTFFSPRLPLFRDPVAGGYGISASS